MQSLQLADVAATLDNRRHQCQCRDFLSLSRGEDRECRPKTQAQQANLLDPGTPLELADGRNNISRPSLQLIDARLQFLRIARTGVVKAQHGSAARHGCVHQLSDRTVRADRLVTECLADDHPDFSGRAWQRCVQPAEQRAIRGFEVKRLAGGRAVRCGWIDAHFPFFWPQPPRYAVAKLARPSKPRRGTRRTAITSQKSAAQLESTRSPCRIKETSLKG